MGYILYIYITKEKRKKYIKKEKRKVKIAVPPKIYNLNFLFYILYFKKEENSKKTCQNTRLR